MLSARGTSLPQDLKVLEQNLTGGCQPVADPEGVRGFKRTPS